MRPVLVVVDDDSGELARRAAAAGLDAALVGANAFDVAVRLALKQLLELQQLRQKVDRQARVERAKGVLMERYRLPEPRAHELLQRHARNMNLKLTEVADAVVESHTLFADSSAIIPRRVPGDAA